MESLSSKQAANEATLGPLTFLERWARPIAVILSVLVWMLIISWAWAS